MARLLAILVLVVLSISLACGGDDDSDGSSSDEDPAFHVEDDLARSLLLTLDDFPSGWSEMPADDEEEGPFDHCDEGPGEGRTGVAETGDFSRGDNATLSHQVGAFETPEDALSALDRAERISDCVVEVVNGGGLDDRDAEYSDASFGPLSFPSFGDGTEAYRLQFRARARGESGLGSEGTLYFDFVYVAEGRLAFALQAFDLFSPFDTAMLESLASSAHDRLAGADR